MILQGGKNYAEEDSCAIIYFQYIHKKLEGIYWFLKGTTLIGYSVHVLTKQFLACFHILVVTTGIIYHMHRNVLQIVSNSQSSFLIATKFKHALPLPHGHPHPQTKLFHTRFYPKFLNIS